MEAANDQECSHWCRQLSAKKQKISTEAYDSAERLSTAAPLPRRANSLHASGYDGRMTPPPAIHPAFLDSDALLAECRVRFTRRSGPGGQHRNKVETAVVLHHLPTEIEAEASERRSQAENRQMALWRLRIKLALGIRCPVMPDTAPSQRWLARLQGSRIAVSTQHADYPALLAEALDRLAVHGFEPQGAAKALRTTASQLWKLLEGEPLAVRQVNDARRTLGLRPLA
jgi:hypothetical protein